MALTAASPTFTVKSSREYWRSFCRDLTQRFHQRSRRNDRWTVEDVRFNKYPTQTGRRPGQMRCWIPVALLCAASAVLADDLEKARRIHKEAIGVDSHIDTLQWVIYQ